MRIHTNRLLAIGIILFAPLVYFGLLFTTYGLGPFEDDLIQYFPNLAWLGESLRAGIFPFWNGLVYGGYSQVGDPQSGVLYPVNWLTAVLSMRWAYPLLLVMHYWLAGFGMYWLGRQWGLSRGASVFGAVAWMFSGFMLGHRTHYTMLAAAAWMSVIFYLWTRIREEEHPQTLWVVVIFCQAMQIFAGHVQVAMMTAGAVFLYLLFTVERRWIRCWIFFFGSYLLTLGIVAVQLLPVWQLYAESVRSANSYLFMTENSFFPLAWTLLIAPASMGLRVPNFLYDHAYFGPWNHCELNCFTTLVAMTLAAFSVRNVARVSNRRRLVIFLIVLAVAAVFLSLGRYNPVFKAMYQLSIFRPFRCPARYILWFNFAIAALAMIGMQSLHFIEVKVWFSKFARRFVTILMIVFVVYLAVLAVLVRIPFVTSKLPASLAKLPAAVIDALTPANPAIIIPLVIGLLTVGSVLYFTKQLTRVLLVLLLIEIGTFAPFYDFHFDEIGKVNLYPPIARTLDEVAGKSEGFIWPLSKDPYRRPLESLQPFTNLLVGRASITGYGPLLNKYQRRLFNWELWPTTGNYIGILNRPDMLNRYNIRYILADAEISRQIDALKTFSESNRSGELFRESVETETVIRPDAGWRVQKSFSAGMYRIRFVARRLSVDQLRLAIKLNGIDDSIWVGQQLVLNTWDINENWRWFEWCFFVPEHRSGGSAEIEISTDYGVCEIRGVEIASMKCDLSSLRFVAEKEGVCIYENTRNFGSFWFARIAKAISEPKFFAERRMKTADQVLFSDEHDVVWLASHREIKLEGKQGIGRILSWQRKANTLQMEVRVSTTPGVLVLPGGYNDQWRVLIDGFEGPMLCADGISRAVIVPPGEHSIVVGYVPEMFQVGMAVGAFTGLLMIFIYTVGLSKRSNGKSE